MADSLELTEREQQSLSASPRLFANPLLDKLSRVHHLAPLFIYMPVIAVLIGMAIARLPPWRAVACVPAGYVVWTLVEYFGHRFLFHGKFPGRLGARIHFLIHGVHHDYPSDPLRLVMPPLLSAPILIIGFGLLRLAFGPDLVAPVFAGFLGGYLTYDMVHYHLHHGYMRTRLGQALRQRHMSHHFRDDTVWFGVSAPWWDKVFRTAPQRQFSPSP